MSSKNKLRKVVVVDGCRTPFMRSNTEYKDMMAYQLGAKAIRGLVQKTGLSPEKVDRVVLGTTIARLQTSNVAREAALYAGISHNTICSTVTLACISANQAIAQGVDQIQLGHADIVIAGGTDSASDFPITLSKNMREKLVKSQKMKNITDYIGLATTLKPGDFAPEIPAVAEMTTGRTMGQDCERLADRVGVSRTEQDEYAVRSHKLAYQATMSGQLVEEMADVAVAPKFKPLRRDNGIRGDSTVEKVGTLKPAFAKPYGTLTAANSSFLTDGAAVVLLMSEEKALELGYQPKAVVTDYVFTAQDLNEELLLGPAYATPKVLEKTGLKLEEIDVFEFHEAFAGQILANIKCLASDEFAKEKLGKDEKIGEVDMNKFNNWGGSLSIGHPFGATGARLVTTACNRLIQEEGKYALIAACAGGAHGHAMVLERYN